MQAGKLRHRVTIQSQSIARNGSGEEIITWIDAQTIWAEVQETKSAREGYIGRADQLQATSDYQVITRYWAAAQPGVKQRLKWGAIYLDVQNAIPDARNRQMTIFCKVID